MKWFQPANPALYTPPVIDGNLGPFISASILNSGLAEKPATFQGDTLSLKGAEQKHLEFILKGGKSTKRAGSRAFSPIYFPEIFPDFPDKVSLALPHGINEVLINYFGFNPVSDHIFEDARAFWVSQPTDPHYLDADSLLYSCLFLNLRDHARMATSGYLSDNNIAPITEMLHRHGYDLNGLSLLLFAAQFPFLEVDSDSLIQLLIKEHIAPRTRELRQGKRSDLFCDLPGIRVNHRFMHPLSALAVQYQTHQWGWKDVRTSALSTFMEMIDLKPNDTLKIFPDVTFETEIRLATFEEPVDLEPLHHLARLFQAPETLAQHLLADYKNKIPSDLWDIIAQQIFEKPDMKTVSQNVDSLIPDGDAACSFLFPLLGQISSQHSWPYRWRTAWKHFWGKGPSWKEKRDRLALLTVKIVAILTLQTKYNVQKQEELLALKKKLKKMEPAEVAGAVESVRNFFRDELMEIFDNFPLLVKLSPFIPKQVLHQLEKLKNLDEKATQWRRKVQVDFIPRREILDAFFGVAGDNCTGKIEFVTHALSDPAFQPVRILVDGEFSGSFMTYSTVFKKFIPPKILGAHETTAYETERRALIIAGVDSRFRFDPESFTGNLRRYLREVATNGNYDLVLLPKYEGSQSSHDIALRKALQKYTVGTFTTEKDIYFPKRGPGNDPEMDYHPHSASKNGYWVLLYRKSAEQFIQIENHEMEPICRL